MVRFGATADRYRKSNPDKLGHRPDRGNTDRPIVAAERLALVRVLLPQAVAESGTAFAGGIDGGRAFGRRSNAKNHSRLDRGVGTDDG